MVDGKAILDALLGAASVDGKQENQAGGGIADVLGQLMGGSNNAASNRTGGESGGLGSILGQMFGGSGSPQTQADTQTGGGLGDLLGQVLGGTAGSGTGGGGGGGGLVDAIKNAVANNPGLTQAALAGVAGLVIGSGSRGLASGAAKLGGIALIGGLAYKALKNYQNKAPDSAFANEVALPKPADYKPVAASNDGALKLVRVMIGAAMADGTIDAEEQRKILGKISENGLREDQKAWLNKELSRPATAKQAADGITTAQEAVETYAAARVVIDPDSPPNKAFLDTLADELALPPQLVAEIDRAVDGVKVETPA